MANAPSDYTAVPGNAGNIGVLAYDAPDGTKSVASSHWELDGNGNHVPGGVVVLTPQSIPASDMSGVSTTYNFAFQILNRNAKSRYIMIGGPVGSATVTPIDQYVTVAVTVVDSLLFGSLSGDASPEINGWRNVAYTATQANIGVNLDYVADFSSDDTTSVKNSFLAKKGDTLIVQVLTGTTPPSTGELYVQVVEVI